MLFITLSALPLSHHGSRNWQQVGRAPRANTSTAAKSRLSSDRAKKPSCAKIIAWSSLVARSSLSLSVPDPVTARLSGLFLSSPDFLLLTVVFCRLLLPSSTSLEPPRLSSTLFPPPARRCFLCCGPFLGYLSPSVVPGSLRLRMRPLLPVFENSVSSSIPVSAIRLQSPTAPPRVSI